MTRVFRSRLHGRSDFLVLLLLCFAFNFRKRFGVGIGFFEDGGGDEHVPRHTNRVDRDKAAIELREIRASNFLCPRLELRMNVEFAIDMVHVIVPDHLITE